MEKKQKPIFKCGTTQLNLPWEARKELKRLANSIPDENLAGEGRDVGVPHITLRWGVVEADDAALQAIVERFMPFYVALGTTSSFPPSVSSDGAGVVMIEVHSPILKQIHEAIGQECECKPYDFDYTPHATVAYVKPELRHNYEGLTDLEGYEWIADTLTFSDRYGNQKDYKKGGSNEPEQRNHADYE